MAAVRIESKAFTDARLKVLAKKLNIHWHRVLGVMIDLWRECTESEVYHLDADTIDALAEIEGFCLSMVESGLGRIQKSGKIYLVGTKGKTDWLAERRESSRKGGEANRKRIRNSKKELNAQKSLHKNGEPNDSQTIAKREPKVEPNDSPPTLTPTLTPTKKENFNNTTTYVRTCNEPSRVEPNQPSVVVEKNNWDDLDLSVLQMIDPTCTKKWAKRISETSDLDAEAAQDSIDKFIFDVAHRAIPSSVAKPIGLLTTALRGDGYFVNKKFYSRVQFETVKASILAERRVQWQQAERNFEEMLTHAPNDQPNRESDAIG